MSFCKFSIVLKYINENAAFPLEIVFNQKMGIKWKNSAIDTYIDIQIKVFQFFLTESGL